jgi:stress response protein YsnF
MLVYEKNCTRLAVTKKLKFEKERLLVLSDRKRKVEVASGMSLNNYKTDRSISTLKKRVSMQSSMLSPSERSPSCMK